MKTTITTCLLGLMSLSLAAQDQGADSELLLAHSELKFAPASPAAPEELAVQPEVYKLDNWKVDAPVTAVGAVWSIYAFSKIYSKPSSTEAEINALRKEDINGFDRWAAGMDDNVADKNSDYLFYGSMPLPAVLFLDKSIRKDAAKVGFLYLESMAITGLLYTGSTYFTNRYRPETYNTDQPANERLGGGYKNSFFAGHVALVGTATFFTAKVFNDYHPDSKLRWVFWGGAAAATGLTAYWRHTAGKHFPSDIIVGTAVGVLSGILVPHLHKVKNPEDQAWHISPTVDPYSGGYGLSFRYNIK